jgi:hypothetical protein
MKKSSIISSVAGLVVLCFCVTAQAQDPTVTTDKADYAPGETVHITATGFQPLELVDFSIAIADDNGLWIPDVAWKDIAADSSGGATSAYLGSEYMGGQEPSAHRHGPYIGPNGDDDIHGCCRSQR